MKNQYQLKTVTIACYEYSYFHTTGGTDENRRHHVFIIDPDGPAVYETFFKCNENQIPEYVETFILDEIGITLPF